MKVSIVIQLVSALFGFGSAGCWWVAACVKYAGAQKGKPTVFAGGDSMTTDPGIVQYIQKSSCWNSAGAVLAGISISLAAVGTILSACGH